MNDMAPGNPGQGPCRIAEVTKDSSAEAAGLQPNDQFVTMDGKQVANCDSLVTSIQARQPGDVVKFVVNRDGRNMTIKTKLLSRDEVLRKRFGGLPVPTAKLVRVDDKQEVDISAAKRATTIIGWFPTTCTGCDQIFTLVNKWSKEERNSRPIKVAAATAGDTRMQRSVADNLELLKSQARMLDVPLLVADQETYKSFTIGDGDRVQFMVIDCRGIVQYASFVVPNAEDQDAVLDELYAAAEQASREKK
jgi:membrane-associated protease RseP (regulator of RpoE activity)